MQIKGIGKTIYFIAFTLLFFAAQSFAFNHVKPLSGDKAFAISFLDHADKTMIKWKIANGYYLYRKSMAITVSPAVKYDANFPKGTWKNDKASGTRYEAYKGQISVPITFHAKNQPVNLSVTYQGCSDRGFCYPPMHKNITLTFGKPKSQQTVHQAPAPNQENVQPTAAADTSFSSLLTNQNDVKNILYSKHFGLMLIMFLGLGLLLAFTPCVLPMIPILTSIIVGQREAVSTTKAFLLSLSYVMGSAVTYAVAGVIAALMGHSLQVWLQQPAIIALFCSLFVLLAFSLFGFFELRLPNSLQNRITGLSNQQKAGTYVGVFLMGMLSTLIVSPCVTAPLVGILMYIGQTGDLVFGGSALFSMGFGMGIPLLLIGMSASRWLPKSGVWMEAVKKFFGILMLAMAIWLFSRIVPLTVTMVFYGLLLLGFALFLGIYLPQVIKLQKLLKGLSVVIGVSGMLVIFGGIGIKHPMVNWLFPSYAEQTNQVFKIVRNVADLKAQLALAQAAHQPVIVDFYADWCKSCVAMDRNVFSMPDVQQKLGHYTLLRADLSNNSEADEALLKHFDVIAPPTVIFFDAQGKEVDSQRIIGEVNAKEFLGRLESL